MDNNTINTRFSYSLVGLVLFLIFFMSVIHPILFYPLFLLPAIFLFNKYKYNKYYTINFQPFIIVIILILFFIFHLVISQHKNFSFVFGTIISLFICLGLIQKINYRIVEKLVIIFGVVHLFFAIWYLVSFSSLFGLFNHILPKDTIWGMLEFHSQGKNVGINSQTSSLAYYLSLLLGILYIKYREHLKINVLFLILLAIVALLSTSRRGAFVFSMLGIFTLFIFYKKYSFIKILLFVSSVLVLFSFGIYMLLQNGFEISTLERMDLENVDFSDYNSINELSSSRLSLIFYAYDFFQSSPILGKGFKFFFDEMGQDVHNLFLQLLCEAGIIGFTAIISFISYNFITTINLLKKRGVYDKAIMYSFYCQFLFIMFCFVENPLSDRYIFLNYVIAISLLYNRMLNIKIESMETYFNNFRPKFL